MKRRTVLMALAGALIAGTAPMADARRRGLRMRGLANGAKHNGPVLSRDELRQCLAEQDVIESREAEVNRLQSSIAQSEASIAQLENRIRVAEPLVDRYNRESVAAYNDLIARHTQLVNEHNAKLPAINRKAAELNTTVDRFNAKCADRAYYESDMAAIRASR